MKALSDLQPGDIWIQERIKVPCRVSGSKSNKIVHEVHIVPAHAGPCFVVSIEPDTDRFTEQAEAQSSSNNNLWVTGSVELEVRQAYAIWDGGVGTVLLISPYISA